MVDEEGMDFAATFNGTFGSLASTASRLKAERRAGLTTRQRQRKAVRVVQINFRASAETKALAEQLADALDCSVADVMERAIQALAAQSKIGSNGK